MWGFHSGAYCNYICYSKESPAEIGAKSKSIYQHKRFIDLSVKSCTDCWKQNRNILKKPSE